MRTVVDIDGGAIANWDDFHAVFAEKLGFPDFYGRNMNAWIDCMTSLDAPEDGLSEVHVADGEILTINVANADRLKSRSPDVLAALNDCAAFVNWRRLEVGDRPILAMAYGTTG